MLDFAQLLELEPELATLEEAARAIEDDGESSFFCSNFLWLPMYTTLKKVIGVHRPPLANGKRAGILYESHSFEVAYLHLSRILPPCRDCGCRLFERVREEQWVPRARSEA